jgi:pyruvate formate lyase activating enzyme
LPAFTGWIEVFIVEEKTSGTARPEFKEAVLWEPAGDGKVRCNLCGFRCLIGEGRTGRCLVRRNTAGVLYSLNYGRLCAANADPIEKKPLFHFQPGSRSFSIAAVGCNFKCGFCQNWQISQPGRRGRIGGRAMSPGEVIDAAVAAGCASVAYTYTEPTVFMEFCADCGRVARERGLANVFVSNGYQTREAIDFAAEWLDGINVDLKSFSDGYYRKLCKATLDPVLDTIRYVAGHTDMWMEVTTLVVPGLNDSDAEFAAIAGFLAAEAGPDVPWHISRFYPNYRMLDAAATPAATLERAAEIAGSAGLRYVYLGNVPAGVGADTRCYNCGRVLIRRAGYTVISNRIEHRRCPDCFAVVAGFGL